MSWLGDFHFLRPLWLTAWPLVLWLLHRQRHHFMAQSTWSQVIAPELLPHLLNDNGTTSPKRWLYPLMVLAASLLVIALAGPSWRQIPQPVFETPAHRVVVMDLSLAMDAQDLKPSRLKRSQLLAQQLLEQQDEGDTALVAFSAEAFPVVPLTSDRGTVSHLLHSLSTDIMPAAGNNFAAGLQQATELLRQTGATRGDIVVFTASPVTSAVESAAAKARQSGYRIHILGAGTTEGAPIPAQGGWLKNAQGAIQLSRLDESALRQLAQQNGGRYKNVQQAGAAYQLDLNAEITATQQQDSGQDFQADLWQDEGPWLLLPLLIIGAFAFRRGWLMLVLVSVTLHLPTPVYAGWWKKDDQTGYQHYQSGDYESAAQRFSNADWKASALYKAGQYQQAAELWQHNQSAQGRYNLGNALARAGELDSAIQAYEDALRLEPNHADAQANKALLEQLKQQQDQNQNQHQQQQSPDQAQEGEPQDNEDSSSEQTQGDNAEQQDQSSAPSDASQESEQSEQQDAQDEGNEQSEPETAEPQPQPADSAEDPTEPQQNQAMSNEQEQHSDEQAQAVQQWLKRIPDDPGGLLRRKFERMEQRRRESQR